MLVPGTQQAFPSLSEPPALWHALTMRPYGHRISANPQESGAHVVLVRPGKGLEGGADPRREGVARGD